jgi:hypothetical protein
MSRVLFQRNEASDSPFKKKGGSPEDARQRGSNMAAILESNIMSNTPRPFKSVNSPDRNAALWLEDQIARAANGVVTHVVDLTPALARVLINRNPDNRRISAVIVESYARDMASGSWAFNGEPIIVSNDGLLNDGQHRCEAVIQSGATIPAIIVIGPDRSSRLTVDQGKMRQAGDYLSMNGYADGNSLAAAAKYIWQHKQYGQLSHQTLYSPTKTEILDLVEATPTIAESVKAIPKKGAEAVGGRSVLAFLHWTFTRVSGSKTNADLFMDSLIRGSNLVVRSPILYARNRLMAERGRIKTSEKAELIIRAWNASRRGQKVATLPVKGGPLPIVER